ncbi:MAG TPA: hypothetical protein VGN12_14450 [Pirellulales bacterium]|jgi:hypothetical protein
MRANLAVKAMLVATFLVTGATAAEPAGAEYYPLKAGSEWRYHLVADGVTKTFESRITKIEEIDGLPLARFDAEINGEVVATEHLRITDEGVLRYRYNGSEVTPPVCILKFPIKDGETWQSENRVGNQDFVVRSTVSREEVDVPYGKYEAVKVTATTEQGGQLFSTTYWFAPGIGNVKQVLDLGGKKFELDLFEFTLGQ